MCSPHLERFIPGHRLPREVAQCQINSFGLRTHTETIHDRFQVPTIEFDVGAHTGHTPTIHLLHVVGVSANDLLMGFFNDIEPVDLADRARQHDRLLPRYATVNLNRLSSRPQNRFGSISI